MRIILIGSLFLLFVGCEEADKFFDKNESVEESTNIKPIANAGEDRSVKVNESITIVGAGYDEDGVISTYLWENREGALGTTAVLNYRPTTVGREILTLTVTDDDGATAQDNMHLEIEEFVENDPLPTPSPAPTSTPTPTSMPTATTPPIPTPTPLPTVTPTTSPEVRQIPAISDSLKQEYLSAINQARSVEQDCRSAGIFPATTALSWSDKLYKASYEHSYDLATSDTFDHAGSGTASDWTGTDLGKQSSMQDRIEAYGYNWSRIAENIAAGTNTNTAIEVIDQWLGSDGHCANLMNADFSEVGMAMVKDEGSTYIHYWTQNFATPR